MEETGETRWSLLIHIVNGIMLRRVNHGRGFTPYQLLYNKEPMDGMKYALDALAPRVQDAIHYEAQYMAAALALRSETAHSDDELLAIINSSRPAESVHSAQQRAQPAQSAARQSEAGPPPRAAPLTQPPLPPAALPAAPPPAQPHLDQLAANLFSASAPVTVVPTSRLPLAAAPPPGRGGADEKAQFDLYMARAKLCLLHSAASKCTSTSVALCCRPVRM